MTRTWVHLRHRLLTPAWTLLRSIAGDDAYDRYAAHAARVHPGQAPLSRYEFYDAELRRKWSGVNRCC